MIFLYKQHKVLYLGRLGRYIKINQSVSNYNIYTNYSILYVINRLTGRHDY